jgi:hypothetical protein
MDIYVLDSGSLIDLYNHFRGKFRILKKLAKEGYLKIPEGVYRELRRKTDRLYQCIEDWKLSNNDCIVHINRVHNLAEELVRIELQYGERIRVEKKEYPGFWKSPSGRKAADSQIVATAKVLGCIAVSDDRAVRMSCMLESIPCISWTELARRLELSSSQLKLL